MPNKPSFPPCFLLYFTLSRMRSVARKDDLVLLPSKGGGVGGGLQGFVLVSRWVCLFLSLCVVIVICQSIFNQQTTCNRWNRPCQTNKPTVNRPTNEPRPTNQ
jgi:hypothetical protein